MGGLEAVIRAASHLHGERNAPELPIPASAIRDYARRFRLSDTFVLLVQNYDQALLGAMYNRSKKVLKDGTTASKK